MFTIIIILFTYTDIPSTTATFSQTSSTTIAPGINYTYVSANQPVPNVPPHIVASLASSGIIPTTGGQLNFVQLPPSVTSEQALALVQETTGRTTSNASVSSEGIAPMQNSTSIMQNENGILSSTAIVTSQVSPSVMLTKENTKNAAAVSLADSLGTSVGSNQVTPVISSVMQCQPELTTMVEMTDSAICLTEGSEPSSAENLMEQFYSNRQETPNITPTANSHQ